MKVAFWNGISMSDNMANYVAAIGMILALEHNCKVVLSSNYISNRMMQDCFYRRMLEEGIAHPPYCFLYGSPEYYGALWSMKRNRQNDILEVPMKGVTIVFPPDVAEKSMFYYSVPRDVLYLLDMAKCSISESKNVLDEAELVVVFLSQSETEIQKFFERFSSLVPKAIFVIVDYQRDTENSCRKIKAKYGINNDDIGIIPHNDAFENASEEGKLEQFILNGMHNTTEKCNYSFISNIRKLAKKIYMRKRYFHVQEQKK